MIIFLGDSFTWGQGLYSKKWIKEGKDVEFCNKHLPPNFNHQNISYSDDEYRRKYHFPNLVAKHYDRSYFHRTSNGGSNNDLTAIAHTLPNHCPLEGIDFVVVQFTEFTRSLDYNYKLSENITNFDEFIYKECKRQIQLVYDNLIGFNIKDIFMFSWRDDIGKILKSEYPEHFVPLFYKDIEYKCFEDMVSSNNELTLIGEIGTNDGHFSELGHRVIADSIIKKVDTMNINFIRPREKSIL